LPRLTLANLSISTNNHLKTKNYKITKNKLMKVGNKLSNGLIKDNKTLSSPFQNNKDSNFMWIWPKNSKEKNKFIRKCWLK